MELLRALSDTDVSEMTPAAEAMGGRTRPWGLSKRQRGEVVSLIPVETREGEERY